MGNSYQFDIGNTRCVAINDGDYVGNADMLFANAPEEELLPALSKYGLNRDHLPSTWTCLLVKTASNLALVDTGVGAGGEYGGQLLPMLRARGYQPEDIDTVILTHAHPDHIGGCVDSVGNATFSEATYYMWRDEWEFWTDEESLKRVPDWAAEFARQKLPAIAHQLETINDEIEIVPGIRALPAPGHTIGHMAVEIASNGEFLLNIADTALHPLQVEYPEWYARLDQFPDQTEISRRAIYARAAARNALVLGFHFHPFPSLGRITGLESNWKWQPLTE